MSAKTLFDKVWERHVVVQEPDCPAVLYIDLHLVHEVTSPQAFDALRLSGRTVRRPDLTVSTIDHGVPTADRHLGLVALTERSNRVGGADTHARRPDLAPAAPDPSHRGQLHADRRAGQQDPLTADADHHGRRPGDDHNAPRR